MKISDIEKAAQEYSGLTDNPKDTNSRERGSLCIAFKDGARWYSENIWHSSEEKPKPLSCCLVEYIDEDIDDEFTNYEVTHYATDNVGFIGDARSKKITRWANVEDLLPIKLI